MPTDPKSDAFWRAERAAEQLFPGWVGFHMAYKARLRRQLMAIADNEDTALVEQLTDNQRAVHDDAFLAIFEHAMAHNVPLNDGDECVDAGAALARWIIASNNT